MTIILICNQCGKEFHRKPSLVRSDNMYCSKVCYTLSQREFAAQQPDVRILLACPNCGKEFYKYPSQITKDTCCSKECASTNKRGKRISPRTLKIPDEQIIFEYNSGDTLEIIGNRYGVDKSAIAYRLQINGVSRRPGRNIHTGRLKPQKIMRDKFDLPRYSFPEKQNVCGIYEIFCTTNNRFYIGSSKNLLHRRNDHLHLLNTNQHHSIHLQRAWNKYGKDVFEFWVIEFCEISMLVEREQFYIDILKPEYNILTSTTSSRRGRARDNV